MDVARLYQEMREEIELFPTGTRLPSFREQLARRRCSRQTMIRALAELERDGIIRREQRNGIFVNKTVVGQIRRIVFVRVDWNCEHAERFSEAFRREMGKRQKYRYTELRFPPENNQSFWEELKHSSAELLVLWLEELPPEQMLKFCTMPCHTIFFDCGLMVHDVAIFDLQEELIGMMAARFLVEHGHRKIALLITEPQGLTCRKKINGFLDYLHLEQIEPRIIDFQVHHGDATQSFAYDFLSAYLKRNRVDFSACFALSDSTSLGVIKAFEEAGFQIPEQISIISCQGEMAGEYSSPPLSTVIFDMERAAQMLAIGIDEVFAGGEFGIRRIAPILIDRKSVDVCKST